MAEIKKHNNKKYFLTILFLQGSLLLMSFSSVLSKYAAQNEFLSLKFILFYGASLLCLFIYAILWQQILKRISLNTAYANRSVLMIWSMIWGRLLFGEEITWKMILGAAIMLVGVYLVVASDKEKTDNSKKKPDELRSEFEVYKEDNAV